MIILIVNSGKFWYEGIGFVCLVIIFKNWYFIIYLTKMTAETFLYSLSSTMLDD